MPRSHDDVYCVLDTNIHMECKPFGEIDWLDVLDAKKIFLLIPSPVVEELDNHKENNPRKNKRSRAQRAIKDLARTQDRMPSGGDGLVRQNVFLRFLPPPPFQHAAIIGPTDNDGRILASALVFKDDTGITPMVMTADLNMRLRATAFELSVKQLARPNDLFYSDDGDEL